MNKKAYVLSLIKKGLNSDDSKAKYLNILNQRIEDNRKSMGRLFYLLVLVAIAFPLIFETKIAEVNLGPFKIIDLKVVLAIVPTLFSFFFYKYLMVWFDLVEQKRVHYLLTAEMFSFDKNEYLNDQIQPFSITTSVDKHHAVEKVDFFRLVTYFLWIPTGLILLIIPYVYQIYMLINIFKEFPFKQGMNWIIIVPPLLLLTFTILILIEVIKKEVIRSSEETKTE